MIYRTIRLQACLMLPTLTMATTCLSESQLAGVVFGSVAVTLAICLGVAVIFWMVLRKNGDIRKTTEKAAFTSDDLECNSNGNIPKVISKKDQITMIDSFKIPRKLLDIGTQKSFSVENLNKASSKVGVLLKTENAAGFGMSIQGNMNEGIYVKDVVPKGVADLTGNILPGDRIKSLTINFDYMVYEDALTLLSYASPYKVKFELERKFETSPSMNESISNARLHPLFRSNTLTHIHFNPIWQSRGSSKNSSNDSSNIKDSSMEVDEPNETMPKKEMIDDNEKELEVVISPDDVESSMVINDKMDNTVIDLSKVESSDYASDNTSEYRESESESANEGQTLTTTTPCSFSNISDHLEVVTNLEIKKSVAAIIPAQPAIQYCKMLPPKQKSVVSRSPSPRMNVISKSPSPVLSKDDAKSNRHESNRPPLPSLMASTKKMKVETESRIPSASPGRVSEPTPGPPEFAEVRVSRIPKRTDSVKTPIIERKLPQLPKSVTQRSHSAEDKVCHDVWSRLYMDKRNTLKKARDAEQRVKPSSEHETTATLSPHPSQQQLRPPTECRFGILDADRRQRIAANQDVLDRQTEELRKLGIL